ADQRSLGRRVDLLDGARTPDAVASLFDAAECTLADGKRQLWAALAMVRARRAGIQDVWSEGAILAHGAADQFAVAVDALEAHDAGGRRLLGRREGALGCAHERAFGFKFVQDAPQFGLVFRRHIEAAR